MLLDFDKLSVVSRNNPNLNKIYKLVFFAIVSLLLLVMFIKQNQVVPKNKTSNVKNTEIKLSTKSAVIKKIPPEFAEYTIFYPGAELLDTHATNTENIHAFEVIWFVDKNIEVIVDYYQEYLINTGWDISTQSENMIKIQKDDINGFIKFENNSGTGIRYSLFKEIK